MTIVKSSEITLSLSVPGSFEDWDPIEDFEHATQYETWNHPYDSEATPKPHRQMVLGGS